METSVLTIINMIIGVLGEGDPVAAISLIGIAAIVIAWLALVVVNTAIRRSRRN